MTEKEKEFNEALQYYLNKGHKIERMRDDIRLRPLARKLGYTIEYGGNFGDSLTFKKGSKHIWHSVAREGGEYALKWVCADLVDGRFCNHRRRDSLETALTEEA